MIFSPFLSIPLFLVMLLLLEMGRPFETRTGMEPSTTIGNSDFALFGLLLVKSLSHFRKALLALISRVTSGAIS